jgi:hypothetical protein
MDSRENSIALRVARVGYRITSKLGLVLLAITLIAFQTGCCWVELLQLDGMGRGPGYSRDSCKERA